MDRQKAKRKRQLRRRRHVRNRIVGTAERPRLTVFRSNKHIYAQLIDDLAGKTLPWWEKRGVLGAAGAIGAGAIAAGLSSGSNNNHTPPSPARP